MDSEKPKRGRKKKEVEQQPQHEKVEIEFPSTSLIVAKKFSGKTNLIIDIIDKSKFTNIFIISGTGHLGHLDKLIDSPDQMLDNISEEFIRRLLEFQVENPDSRTLLIFDDFVGMTNDPKKSDKMRKLATSGRNFNISIVFSSQDLIPIPTLIRRNAEYIFIGNNSSKVNTVLADTYSSIALPKPLFVEKLNEIARKQEKEFLFIDDRRQNWKIYKAEKHI